MRGIGYTLSRLPSARALLAGAAILAGAFTSAAHGQTSGSGNGTGTLTLDGARPDEAAWAVPRIPHGGTSEVAFPQPLSSGDVALMRRIFAFQAHGDIPSAIRSVSELENPLLLGAVLADRLLGRHHRSTADELSDWLTRYDDQPDAPSVHALLLTRLPKGTTPPPAPEAVAAPQTTASEHATDDDPVPEDIDPPLTI
jgi:hypothetical protein